LENEVKSLDRIVIVIDSHHFGIKLSSFYSGFSIRERVVDVSTLPVIFRMFFQETIDRYFSNIF